MTKLRRSDGLMEKCCKTQVLKDVGQATYRNHSLAPQDRSGLSGQSAALHDGAKRVMTAPGSCNLISIEPKQCRLAQYLCVRLRKWHVSETRFVPIVSGAGET